MDIERMSKMELINEIVSRVCANLTDDIVSSLFSSLEGQRMKDKDVRNIICDDVFDEIESMFVVNDNNKLVVHYLMSMEVRDVLIVKSRIMKFVKFYLIGCTKNNIKSKM